MAGAVVGVVCVSIIPAGALLCAVGAVATGVGTKAACEAAFCQSPNPEIKPESQVVSADTAATYQVYVPQASTVRNLVIEYGDGTQDLKEVPAGSHIAVLGFEHTFPNRTDSYGQVAYLTELPNNRGGAVTHVTEVPLPDPITDVVTLAGGLQHSVGLQSNGTVRTWGDDSQGQLGDGGTATDSSVPVQVSAVSGIREVAAGAYHSLALDGNGEVWSWGDNFHGQLGDGTRTDASIPIRISGLTGVTAVSAGTYHSLAVTTDGKVWSWGYNHDGQLGNGTNTNSLVPVQVAGLTGVTVVEVAGGTFHSLALGSDGFVYAWGDNLRGQLGNGTTTDSSTPVRIDGLSGVSGVSAGGHSLALRSGDNTVWAWGNNAYGQLGNGNNSDSSMPVQVAGLTGVKMVASGAFHSLVLTANGSIKAWGFNSYGQLGNGSLFNSNVPVDVFDLRDVEAIAAGGNHSLAATSDRSAWAWGYNRDGQLGNGTIIDNKIPGRVLAGK